MIRETLKSLGRQGEIRQVEVCTQVDAEAMAFVGSPSVRINGVDIEEWARTAKNFGLSCRTYLDGSDRSGVPSRELLRRAIIESVTDASARIKPEPNTSKPGIISSRQSSPISGGRKDLLGRSGSTALVAGRLAAILASTCCLGPLILISLGFSGAWLGNLIVLEPYRPFFIVIAVVALFFAGKRIFRPAHLRNPGEACALPRACRIYKFLFWSCTILVLLALVYPYVARFFY
jgi:mercuric ion transport protein